MALAATTIWQHQPSATAGQVNGGGFNINNANFLTNATATSATGNAPVVSSASYTFVAGDVGSWIYIQAGTNWTPGFYKISSVAAGAATVNATIGAAVQLNTTYNMWRANTVAGIATVASPTGGTFGVDYSQQNTAIINGVSDFAAVGASATLTSLTAGFKRVMVGNIFHQTTTGVGGFGVTGWYEIVSYVNATTVVLDRTPNTGTASVACTGYVGGAMDFNAADPSLFYNILLGGNLVYIAKGSYTLGADLNTVNTSATGLTTIELIGFNTIRGDNPSAFGASSNAPVIMCGANVFVTDQGFNMQNMILTGTAIYMVQSGDGCLMRNVKSTNTSIGSGHLAFYPKRTNTLFQCEFVSQNGNSIHFDYNDCNMSGCYMHDSDIGYSANANRNFFINNLVHSCVSFGMFDGNPSSSTYISQTFYGWQTPQGTGIFLAVSGEEVEFYNNIIANWTLGITQDTAHSMSVRGAYNDWFGNTTLATNYFIDPTDLLLNPQFISTVELTGSTATTSGSVLTDGAANFSTVVDNISYLHVFSGSGVTTGGYLITSHTATTVTVNNALGSGTSVVYSIPTLNLGIGTNLKAQGYPGVYGAGPTQSYMDIGAVQRQESSATSYAFS